MYLTPIFFWNEDGNHYVYLLFYHKEHCEKAGLSDTSKGCDDLKRCFFANTLLNIGLILGFFLTVTAIILVGWMMKRYFFRFTNLLILVSGLNFILMTTIWIILSGSLVSNVKLGVGLVLIPLAGVNQLLCYFVSRWYTNKLYDANFIETLL